MTHLLFVVAIMFGSIGVHKPNRGNLIMVENDVLIRVSLPAYGELCESTPVRGGPDAEIYKPLYILPIGNVVQLREQPEITPRDWVMIKPARWIQLSAICWQEDN